MSADFERRLSRLEEQMSDLRVATTEHRASNEQIAKRTEEQLTDLKTGMLSMQDLMEARIKHDQERERLAAERAAAEANTRKQVISAVLNPQTVIILLSILAAVLGITGLQLTETAGAIAPLVSPPGAAVPIESP